MLKYAFLFLIGITCDMHRLPQLIVEKSSIGDVFVQSNKATLKSLSMQGGSSSDSIKKAAYKNRNWGMKLYWNIATPDSINKQSIRYRFLEELFSEDLPKEVYVVETNTNGGKTITRNFVVYRDDSGHFQAQLYMYFEGKWQKRQSIELTTCLLSDNLSKLILKPGRGFNSDDIIISRFWGRVHNVVASEYYLTGTLAIDSGIKQIIDDVY
jgi:hypothetical protein